MRFTLENVNSDLLDVKDRQVIQYVGEFSRKKFLFTFTNHELEWNFENRFLKPNNEIKYL